MRMWVPTLIHIVQYPKQVGLVWCAWLFICFVVCVAVTFDGYCGIHLSWWPSAHWFRSSLGRLAGGDRRIISRLANWPFLPTFAWPERYFFNNCLLSCDPCMHSTTRAQFLSMFAQRMSSRKISRFFHPRSQVSFWKLFHLTLEKRKSSWVNESLRGGKWSQLASPHVHPEGCGVWRF